MDKKYYEIPTGKYVARIIEEECIGCTLCIKACPFDAISGVAKHMHTVLTQYCTGCKLCIPPCPVDCIELDNNTQFEELSKELSSTELRKLKNKFAVLSRNNKKQRSLRLKKIKQEKQESFERKKHELLDR